MRTGSTYSDDYIQKNVGACICPFCIQAYHSLEENRQRNNHVEVYRYTVKCASEDMVSPRSTLRRVYTTPRGVTPAMFLSSFRCGSSNTQKQSVSNAFQYVVPCPSAQLFSKSITASRTKAFAKIRKNFQ